MICVSERRDDVIREQILLPHCVHADTSLAASHSGATVSAPLLPPTNLCLLFPAHLQQLPWTRVRVKSLLLLNHSGSAGCNRSANSGVYSVHMHGILPSVCVCGVGGVRRVCSAVCIILFHYLAAVLNVYLLYYCIYV